MSSASNMACPLCEADDTTLFFIDDKNYQQVYYHCKNCDLVFVSPDYRLTAPEERQRYEMHENDHSKPYVKFLSRLADPLLAQLNKGAQGLDFGCGVSSAMADLFRHKGHTCYLYDIYFYPEHQLLESQYDFIIASEVIEHLYQPKAVFERWLSMLEPNGVLGIMTGLRPEDMLFSAWWYKNDPTHVALFSAVTFAYLVEQYSLEVIYQQGNVHIFKKAPK